ncbi:hypothetical protein [Aurantiacibacter spongiae]|uniref:Uncharacterized protein n=1 Tax=Aurantiacibacter spongiae TaxID=2488860 RepID=A0A3N5D7F1_9SPHN|nr:hypothetical protein [Aurantiacibacter spongiae]RPF70458.1 hypothetical protein EG799_01545 [Aurantiacibacter spongiae]
MTDLLPTTTKSRTPSPGLLPDERLNDLLLSGDSPVVGPKTAGILLAFANEPEPATATEAQIETMIGKLAIATAQSKLSDREVEAKIEMYWIALRDLPLDDLRAAFVQLVRSSTFLPTPAEVRKAAMREGATRRYAKSRARHLAWLHDREWKPQGKMVDPAEVRALLGTEGG